MSIRPAFALQLHTRRRSEQIEDQDKLERKNQGRKKNEQLCVLNGFSFITIEIENLLTITTRIVLVYFRTKSKFYFKNDM